MATSGENVTVSVTWVTCIWCGREGAADVEFDGPNSVGLWDCPKCNKRNVEL